MLLLVAFIVLIHIVLDFIIIVATSVVVCYLYIIHVQLVFFRGRIVVAVSRKFAIASLLVTSKRSARAV
jgi:hypothetical protein